MKKLPDKWQIIATNDYEAEIIAPYANKMSKEAGYGKWDKKDALKYYLTMENGRYESGSGSYLEDYKLLTFEQFERLVLNKQIETQYDIY